MGNHVDTMFQEEFDEIDSQSMDKYIEKCEKEKCNVIVHCDHHECDDRDEAKYIHKWDHAGGRCRLTNTELCFADEEPEPMSKIIMTKLLLCETHHSALKKYKFSKNDVSLTTNKVHKKMLHKIETGKEFQGEVYDHCRLCNSTGDGLWNKHDGEKVCHSCIKKYNFSTERDKSIKNRYVPSLFCRRNEKERTLISEDNGDY